MSFYVYSTGTCSGIYTLYENTDPNSLPIVKRRPDGSHIKITIQGGHGVSNKHFITPRGVMTKVSDDDMNILLENKSFQRHVKAGFITYDKKNVAPEKKAASMKEKDGSAPLTPQDFVESDLSTGDNKIYKAKDKGL